MPKIAVALALLQLGVLFPAMAADTSAELSLIRQRSGAYFGFRVVTGQLKFKSDTVESDIQLSALPAIAGGIELWPDEQIGIFADIQVGTGAEIDKVLGQKVSLNTSEYRIGGRYRWFLGQRATATAVGLGLGIHGFNQFVRDQRPSILLDRTIVGPQMNGFVTVPLQAGRLWLRGTVQAELPFFVRESPNDSGNPAAFLGYGARLDAVLTLAGRWSLQLEFDYARRDIDFEGLATRGAGTTNGAVQDGFIYYGLSVRYGGL